MAAGRWYVRIPLKLLVFAGVTFCVLFPSVPQFLRHLSHVRDLHAMVQPDAPELESWEAELRERLDRRLSRRSDGAAAARGAASPRDVQREVEKFVYDKVRYRWDWETWGAADYMPTVAEMFAQASAEGGPVYEDCDGRAVVAASLMRRLGYQSTLVTDLRHVWVVTPQGEWMGPGGRKSVVATSKGNKVDWPSVLANVPISLSYGIAVFPLGRELIVLTTAFVLMLRRWSSPKWAAVGLVLLVQGLLFMRLGYLAPKAVSSEVSEWPSWVGLAHVAAGVAALVWAGRVGRRSRQTATAQVASAGG